MKTMKTAAKKNSMFQISQALNGCFDSLIKRYNSACQGDNSNTSENNHPIFLFFIAGNCPTDEADIRYRENTDP